MIVRLSRLVQAVHHEHGRIQVSQRHVLDAVTFAGRHLGIGLAGAALVPRNGCDLGDGLLHKRALLLLEQNGLHVAGAERTGIGRGGRLKGGRGLRVAVVVRRLFV